MTARDKLILLIKNNVLKMGLTEIDFGIGGMLTQPDQTDIAKRLNKLKDCL